MTKPNDREQELASVIRSNLVEMAGKVNPHHIVAERGIRKAMGTSVELPAAKNDLRVALPQEDSNDIEICKTVTKEQPMEVI